MSSQSIPISGLNPLNVVSSSDFIPIVQSSSLTTFRTPLSILSNWISSSVESSSSFSAVSASYTPYALSSSYALTSSFSSITSNLNFPNNSTASYAISSSQTITASYSISSSQTITSSYALASTTAFSAVSASWSTQSLWSVSSSFASNSLVTVSSSWASASISSSYALSASTSTSSSYALTASNALTSSALPIGNIKALGSFFWSSGNYVISSSFNVKSIAWNAPGYNIGGPTVTFTNSIYGPYYAFATITMGGTAIANIYAKTTSSVSLFFNQPNDGNVPDNFDLIVIQ